MLEQLVFNYNVNMVKSLFISEKDNIGIAVVEKNTGAIILFWRKDRWVEEVE